MDSRSDRLLGRDTQPGAEQKPSRADRLLEPHDPYASAGTQAVGSVTDLTPQTEGAGFGTQLKESFIDDPTTKLKVYAKARFPDEAPETREARYGIHEGEVVYQTDDGQLMRETPDTFMEEFQRGVARGTSRLPADAGAVIGAWLGLVSGYGPIKGAVTGAAAGSQVRKAIARYLGEEQTVLENVEDATIEGLSAGLGEKGGELLGRGVDKFYKAKAGPLAAAAGRDLPNIRGGDIAAAEADFARHGIDPAFPPQTTGSARLKQEWEALEGLPESADTMFQAKKAQGPQVQKAIQDYIDDLGPDWTPDRAGAETIAAAKKSIDKLERARALKAKPMYDRAKATAPEIDITDVADQIDTLLGEVPPGSGSERAIKKVQKMLQRTDVYGAETGEEYVEEALESRLKLLDQVKKEMDLMLDGPEGASIQRDTKSKLRSIKNRLVGLMDEASPDYKAGRKKWEELSPAVDARKAGLTGTASRITPGNEHTAAKKLLDTVNSPAAVAKARFDIRKQNPDAWDAVVKTYILEKFNLIKDTTRGTPNIAGGFRDKIVGNERQRQILHAAMGNKQFEVLIEFTDLLAKVSKLFGKESQTVGKGEIVAGMKREASSGLASVAGTDVTAPLKPMARWWQSIKWERYQKNLAEAMVDPKSAARLKKLQHLDPRSRKFMQLFGAFIGADIGGQIAADNPPDFAPAGAPKKKVDNGPQAAFPTKHPLISNPDGTSSNVVLSSFSVDIDGKTRHLAIPTMVEGKQLTPSQALEVAKKHGLGEYPSFDTKKDVEAWIAENHGSVAPPASTAAPSSGSPGSPMSMIERSPKPDWDAAKERVLNVVAGAFPAILPKRYFAQLGITPEDSKKFSEEHPGLVNPAVYGDAVMTAIDLGGSVLGVHTWPAGKQALKEAVTKTKAVPTRTLNKFVKDTDSVSAHFFENQQFLDKDKGLYSAVKANADAQYGESIEFSTLCPKRTVLQNTIEQKQVAMGRGLTVDEFLEVRQQLKDTGEIVPCAACYRESNMMKIGNVQNKMIAKFPKMDKNLFLTQEGIDTLKAKHPKVYNELAKEMGPQGIKMPETYSEYDHQILKWSKARVEKVNNQPGGFRMQSWSDFQTQHLLDDLQVMGDAAVKKAKAHSYTKVPDFVEVNGLTGMKINMSLIPEGHTGLNKAGKLVFDPVEGMPLETALRLREKYPENAGTIAIGASDEHINKLLSDRRIDYVIPYHHSGMSKARRVKQGWGWKDYTKWQNEVDIATGKSTKSPVNFDDWKGNVKKYKQICDERGLKYIFPQFIDHPNYWKLHADFKRKSNAGRWLPDQKPVQMKFDTDTLNRIARKLGKEEGPAVRAKAAFDAKKK